MGSANIVFLREIADGDWEDGAVAPHDQGRDYEIAGRIVERPFLRRSASPEEIDRMNEAVDWSMRFLKDHRAESRCLLAWADARSRGLNNRECKSRLPKRLGVSKSEFERHKALALRLIAEGLKREPGKPNPHFGAAPDAPDLYPGKHKRRPKSQREMRSWQAA